MIGTRAVAPAGLAVLGLVVLLGPRTADPITGLVAERLVRERATVAVAELEDLRDAVQPGLDRARAAATEVVSSGRAPGAALAQAADLIAEAEEAVLPARRAVSALDAARRAWHPGIAPLPEAIPAGELSSIAAQLRAAGPAVDRFAVVRARATGVAGVLHEALRALERRALQDAATLTVEARAAHDVVVAWETDLSTLPVWIETTDAMISAVEQILDATRHGNTAAAAAAADAFAALGDDAATADRALRIALSEGGAALTAAPLERLAAAMRGVEGSRDAAEAVRSEPGR